MIKPKRYTLLFLLALLPLISACNLNDLPMVGQLLGEQTQQPELSLEYQPPFIPVTFLFDENGVSLSGGVSMVTPIGRFGLGVDYPVARVGQVTLVLKNSVEGEAQVYHVQVEDEVHILLEGRAQMSIGRDGVITVDVTRGQIQAIRFTNPLPPTEGEMGIAGRSAGPPPIVVNMQPSGQVELSPK